MLIKVIGGDGFRPFKFTFDEKSDLQSLTDRVESDCSISNFELQQGYPPNDLKVKGRGDATLVSLGVKGGESVRVIPSKGSAHPIVKAQTASMEKTETAAAMERHIIDADNSCLFNAIGFLMTKGRGQDNMAKMYRGFISQEILTDSSGLYCEAVLGKTPEAYAAWVQDPEKWGGEIEMSILAKRLHVQICAVDIQTGVMYTYSPEEEARERLYLIYDGIHYDALVRKTNTNGGNINMETTFHPENDKDAEAQSMALSIRLKEERQFTDTKNFDLRCMVCMQGLVGEAGAREHAKTTGHQNFCEYT